jgi:hypothetical protein
VEKLRRKKKMWRILLLIVLSTVTLADYRPLDLFGKASAKADNVQIREIAYVPIPLFSIETVHNPIVFSNVAAVGFLRWDDTNTTLTVLKAGPWIKIFLTGSLNVSCGDNGLYIEACIYRADLQKLQGPCTPIDWQTNTSFRHVLDDSVDENGKYQITIRGQEYVWLRNLFSRGNPRCQVIASNIRLIAVQILADVW